MIVSDLLTLQKHLAEVSDELEALRQNWLLSESSFLTFAVERGIPVRGVVVGDPGDFYRRGWLQSDSADEDGGLRFHPFRMYPLHKILECRKAFGTFASIQSNPSGVVKFEESAQLWNRIADLAILLEPVYWPGIIGSMRIGVGSEKDFQARVSGYREKALKLVKTLNPKFWRGTHDQLRLDAAWMDKNDKLYALLRVSNWRERENLTGKIAGALWIRHIAEVIRCGFEEAYSEQWPQEYEGHGLWHAAARNRVFGSARPFDDPLLAKPYLARTFGLFTGSSVRWYVEGETEYYAALEILQEPSKTAVELVNLRGHIKSENDNAALKLEDWLKEDQALHRFSMISFDRDEIPRSPNVKAIALQVTQDNIVGSISAHSPDFEFANFSIEELAEVAAQISETHGLLGASIRNADWSGITSSKAFARKYEAISARRLKDEEWGRGLANFALEHPRRADKGTQRPLLQQIYAALHGWTSNYYIQRKTFTFDAVTFESIPR